MYTGSAQWMVGGKQLVVVLIQGTGTVNTHFGVFPGDPVKTICEWREPMDITEETTFSASVAATPSGMLSTDAGGMQGGALPLAPITALMFGLAASVWILLPRQ